MLNIAVAIAISLTQAAAPDALLAKFAGQWVGAGTVLNQPAQVRISWEWTLDGQFLRLTFVNQIGPRRFEGHAYYRALGDGRYRGTWFDNSGAIRPIDARREGDAIVARWGTADTELGETTYRLMPERSMEIVDRVQGKDGAWREFGRVIVQASRDR
jgi:hypothetical protein